MMSVGERGVGTAATTRVTRNRLPAMHGEGAEALVNLGRAQVRQREPAADERDDLRDPRSTQAGGEYHDPPAAPGALDEAGRDSSDTLSHEKCGTHRVGCLDPDRIAPVIHSLVMTPVPVSGIRDRKSVV